MPLKTAFERQIISRASSGTQYKSTYQGYQELIFSNSELFKAKNGWWPVHWNSVFINECTIYTTEGSRMWQFGIICDNKLKSLSGTVKQASKTIHNIFNSQWLCPLGLNSVCPFSVEVRIMDLTSSNILCLERQHGLRNKNMGVRIEQTWQTWFPKLVLMLLRWWPW